MKSSKILLTLSVCTGVVSLAAFILARLAMTDIFHGEPDLTLEWSAVSNTFLPILLFHLVSLAAALVALRTIAKQRDIPATRP